jgi:Xaa-Pro aminopeptidase
MTDTAARLAALRSDLAGLGAEALVITQEHNRRYLTGFTGSAGLVVITATAARLLADARYVEQASREAAGFEVVRVTGRFQDSLAEQLKDLGVKKAAFEAEHVTVAELKRWQESLPAVTFEPVTGQIERQRAVKTPAELDAIRQAAALADAAMAFVAQTIRPGQTEAEMAWSIERFLREHGADGLAFPPIVAAGENGALPHHRPSTRVIQAGEPIVVDLGARLNGYNSDLTRTFCIGPATDPEYAQVFDVVVSANEAARRALRPGMTGLAVDSVARDHIKAAGYGDHFGHGLGHGVGLNVHEGPRLTFVPPESSILAGNVVTVEPGIYLSGRFGVRLEDLVAIHATHVEVLSRAPKVAVIPPGGGA